MKDQSFRQMLYVLPVVLAIAAAVFIARAGMPDEGVVPAPQRADMSVPF